MLCAALSFFEGAAFFAQRQLTGCSPQVGVLKIHRRKAIPNRGASRA